LKPVKLSTFSSIFSISDQEIDDHEEEAAYKIMLDLQSHILEQANLKILFWWRCGGSNN
ncbi:22019_t:CDS:1, partial [Gigaspora rosea]